MPSTSLVPFRFGAVVGAPAGGRGWTDTARWLEDIGFSTFLVPDTTHTPSPFPALAAVAAVTTEIRLGTWVLAAPLRTPGAVARDVATLQDLSAGRFELGLGAGRPGGERDADVVGVPWGSPGERVDRVADTIRATRDGAGPAPRIVMAGAGPRMLRIAGAEAETFALAVSPLADRGSAVAAADRLRDAAGDRARGIELSMQLVSVGGQVPSYVRHRLGADAETLAKSGAAAVLRGDPTDMADQLRSLRADVGVSYVTVPAELAEPMAPVIDVLAGD